MDFTTQVIGFIASTVSFVLWWPQAARVWRCRNAAHELAGVSIASQGLLLGNALLWAVYAVLTHAFWVGAPGLVNAPLAAATIVVLVRARQVSGPRADVQLPEPRPEQADFGCPNCSWDTDAPHCIFVTIPPGYGSRVPCSRDTARLGYPIPSMTGTTN